MGPPSYMRSVVDRNVVMQRITVHAVQELGLLRCVAGRSLAHPFVLR